MRQSKVKLFRKLFQENGEINRQSFKNFKRTYARSPIAKRIEVTKTARKIKSVGNIQRLVVPDARH